MPLPFIYIAAIGTGAGLVGLKRYLKKNREIRGRPAEPLPPFDYALSPSKLNFENFEESFSEEIDQILHKELKEYAVYPFEAPKPIWTFRDWERYNPPLYWDFLNKWFFKETQEKEEEEEEEEEEEVKKELEKVQPLNQKHPHPPSPPEQVFQVPFWKFPWNKLISPSLATLYLTILSTCVLFIQPGIYYSVPITPRTLEALKAILFSATVGIGTNWIAILLLFKPKKKILGLQGIIPKKREVIILSLAKGIRDNLMDEETIKKAIHESNSVKKGMDQLFAGLEQKINNGEFRKELKNLLIQTAKAFTTNPAFRGRILQHVIDLAQKAPSQFMGKTLPYWIMNWWGDLCERNIQRNQGEILMTIENKFSLEIDQTLDKILEYLKTVPNSLEEKRDRVESFLTEKICGYASDFDIEGMLRNKLASMDEDEFHKLINDVSETELATIQYLGALLGAIAGYLLFLVL